MAFSALSSYKGFQCFRAFGLPVKRLDGNPRRFQGSSTMGLQSNGRIHAPARAKTGTVPLGRRSVLVRALSAEGQELLKAVEELIAPISVNVQKLVVNVQKHQQLLGGLVEDGARQQVTRMFGENYQRPLLAKSLQDLALLLPEEVVHKNNRVKQVLLGPLEIATIASMALVEADIPARLLASLQKGVEQEGAEQEGAEQGGAEQEGAEQVGAEQEGAEQEGAEQEGAKQKGWLRADGTVDEAGLGKFIGTCKDMALTRTLKRLRRVCLLSDKDARIQELLLCESSGILCLVAAAFPEQYLMGKPGVFPSDELEFDCRGRIECAQNGDFAYIDVGEVKMVLDYAKAVPQLGVRLGALKWFVCSACGAKAEGVRLVGRLFVSKHGTKEDFIDIGQRDIASREWGFSLYVHRV